MTNVLILTDDEELTNKYARALEIAGYNYIAPQSAGVGLMAIRTKQVQIVVTSAMSGIMDYAQLFDEINGIGESERAALIVIVDSPYASLALSGKPDVANDHGALDLRIMSSDESEEAFIKAIEELASRPQN